MLPQKHRLTKTSDFDYVKKNADVIRSKNFGLLVLEKPKEVFKSGIIVSTKVHKKATDRNRSKRLVREAVHNLLPKINNGYYVIFLVNKSLINSSIKDLVDEINIVFKKAGVIK